MPHFYVNPENISNDNFFIEGEQAHYVYSVRRFNTNDEIMIFDGLGNSYKGKILSAEKSKIAGKILSSSYKMPEFKINLYAAIPKGDRFEWLIEKAGELGVTAVIPINTKRSVNTSFSQNKLERYEKISVAASSQCGRNDIMGINMPIDFKTACEKAATDKNFISILPWESEGSKASLESAAENFKSAAGANIFIGPEGGFENEEVDFAKSLGIKTITLGSNILRVETAAVVASVLILNLFGMYGK
ncbi:MAG: 16S rRNA (uracil(1498)-N(3))-methyltransferase [Endomicrobia bacterium]|nr:16S rRNA (uracil(1498)-N(3))-methyltransferase [Endomicrobiia bacterium]